MTATTFDTFQINKTLKSRGFTDEQAEALTEFARETVRAAQEPKDMTGFATKGDLEAAKSDILKWMFGGFFAIISLLVGILMKLS